MLNKVFVPRINFWLFNIHFIPSIFRTSNSSCKKLLCHECPEKRDEVSSYSLEISNNFPWLKNAETVSLDKSTIKVMALSDDIGIWTV